jgi:glycosyltransferase involved in cell wall biosynthesis
MIHGFAVHSIHTVGSLAASHGGPSKTVPTLVTLGDSSAVFNDPSMERVVRAKRGNERRTIENLVGELHGKRPIILHDHGQWHRINRASAKTASRMHLHRVVSPRGMLSPWAMQHKRWKKRLAWSMFARRDLASASAIHATSTLEERELRALGVKQPIIVLPNGIDERDRQLLQSTTPSNSHPNQGKPYLLFLSRVHKKKGIVELLSVWRRLAPVQCELIIAGNDEQGLMQACSLPPTVRYIGHIEGESKALWIKNASAFVLPTYSENFGIAILEAMMAGVPVVTTTGTPWEIIQTLDAGWYIEPGEEALDRCLREVLQTPFDALKSKGVRCRDYAATNFSWESIGRCMLESYRWILHGGETPSWVHENSTHLNHHA